MASQDAWLACVLAVEQLESGLRPFVQYIIEGPFIASALSLAAASELSALPQPWVWSQPYPSTTKVFPKSYGKWMRDDAVAKGWIRVLFGGAGTVGLHRLGAPPQIPWHNADEQKFADIVADAVKQRAAAWELAKMLIDSLDSDRAAAKAKTGVEGFAVDGLMLLMRFCKVFEESVPPLQAAGVLDVGGPLDEAGRARNHTFHPSGASNFQLTQAEKEDRIGKFEAVLGLVESWEGLPAGCGSAIAAAKVNMAEMKAPGYATPSYDRRRHLHPDTQPPPGVTALGAHESEGLPGDAPESDADAATFLSALEAVGLGSYEPAFAECEYDDLAEIRSLDDRGRRRLVKSVRMSDADAATFLSAVAFRPPAQPAAASDPTPAPAVITREAWLACVLAFEQLESGLRPFVQYIIEGPFIASARRLAESELGALPQPWVWSQPYPSTTKVFPKPYGTWMKNDAVAQGWIRVLFGGAGGAGTVGLHRLGAPSQIPWHNADEQKFGEIVSTDPAKQRAAAWELAKMLIGSLDSDRAVAKAKTGAEGFAVDGLMLLMRYCKLFEDSVPPLQAAGVLDAGGPLDEASRARNHTFHPSGASSFQLTQAEKEERIGKLEAVLDLVESWAALPAGCGSAIAAAKVNMAEMKAPGYVIGDLDRLLKAEAGDIKAELASLADGVAMLCAALPDNWREIAAGPLRNLGLDQLPTRLGTVEAKLDLQAQLEQALAARLQAVQEQLGRIEAVTVESAASSSAAAASSSAAAASSSAAAAVGVVGAAIGLQYEKQQHLLAAQQVAVQQAALQPGGRQQARHGARAAQGEDSEPRAAERGAGEPGLEHPR